MMTVTIMKKKPKKFKNSGGNIPGGNFPGGNLMGGNFPGWNFPDTGKTDKTTALFWTLDISIVTSNLL